VDGRTSSANTRGACHRAARRGPVAAFARMTREKVRVVALSRPADFWAVATIPAAAPARPPATSGSPALRAEDCDRQIKARFRAIKPADDGADAEPGDARRSSMM